MEWNYGLTLLFFLIYAVPVVFLYLIVKRIIKFFPSVQAYLDEAKSDSLLYHLLIEVVLVAVSVMLTYGLLALLVYIKGGGLLE